MREQLGIEEERNERKKGEITTQFTTLNSRRCIHSSESPFSCEVLIYPPLTKALYLAFQEELGEFLLNIINKASFRQSITM
jgi:hypothetical protein